eukprot:Colp12_sorted_trinity150504_noHs@27083
MSASIAGMCCAVCTNPLWVVKARLMTQTESTTYRYNGTFHALRTIAAQEGLRGFYKGIVPSLFGVGHVIVQFPLYEKLKETFYKRRGHPDKVDTALAASMSKMVASMTMYPHEVIRTRLQNQVGETRKYKGMLSGLLLIIREEGVRALYRGMGTNLMRTTPAGVITLTSYETILGVLASWDERARGVVHN